MQLPINIRDFKGQITSKHQKIAGWLKIFILIIIVTAIGSGFVFNNREKPIPVNVIKVKSESIEKVVFTSGRLEAADEQEFFTAVDSTLMDLNVKVGDRVNKGEILGRLDTLELERRYKEAVASLAGKEAELAKAAAVNENLNLKALHSEYLMTRNKMNRIEELLKAGAASLGEKEAAQAELDRVEAAYLEARTRYNQGASVKQYDSLQAQVELARQEMNQASERLDMATFVAMSNGVVTYIGAQKGNRVMEGSLLLVVGSDRELKVTADVNEIDAGNLKPGQKAEITCVALAGHKYNGAISRVGAAAVTQSGSNGEQVSVPVTITLDSNHEDLRIGYSVNIRIVTSRQNKVFALPLQAIVERDGKKIVYLVKDGKIVERAVRTKLGNEMKDIIIAGIKPGEQVISNPASSTVAGQKVVVQEQKL